MLVGVRARARLAGGYFFLFSAWYAFLEHTIQNKIKIKNNPRARAPELVRAHPNWWNLSFGARARTRVRPDHFFLFFEWYGA